MHSTVAPAAFSHFPPVWRCVAICSYVLYIFEAYSTALSVMLGFVLHFQILCLLFTHIYTVVRTVERQTQTFKVYHFNQFEIIFMFILLSIYILAPLSRSFFYRHTYNFKMIEWLNAIVSLCWLVLTLFVFYTSDLVFFVKYI